MKIIREIIKLGKAVRSLFPVAGEGIAIEKTPKGTIYSLLDLSGATDLLDQKRGMFEIIDAGTTKDDEGNDVYNVSIINGANEESEICGVCHVNRQPFEVDKENFVVVEYSYIYLKFSAPVEAAENIPAKVTAVIKTELQESTDEVVYHLIGQVWIDDDVLHLQQDHQPGNCFIEWYGPCLGLLEEK